MMAKIFNSKFKLVKRYARFSNTCVYLKANEHKKIRYGYKVYQKIFRRYRSKRALRINVRKPRISIKRKTSYGKAMEIKEKFSYLLGGIHSGKLKKYVHLSRSKFYAPMRTFMKKIESRLDIILYRINIVQSPKWIRALIKLGYVRVNGLIRNKTSFFVKPNNYVDLYVPYYIYPGVKKQFKEMIKKKLIFKLQNTYSETSYKIFRAISHSAPTEKTIFYPFNFKTYYFFRLYPR
jgi:ribosomal protein S4